MSLKILMEEKQLDFSQPLLSVRRFTSTQTCAEVSDRRKPDKTVPSIPPIPYYKSELKSGPIRNPGTVPFTWERSPGRPKDVDKVHSRALKRPPAAPRLPPGRIVNAQQQLSDKGHEKECTYRTQNENVLSSPQSLSSFIMNVDNNENSSDELEDNGSSGSSDSDEVYLDAVGTLSRTESFLNCSVSGVSGADGPDVNPPSGTFSTDPQTRDFMMRRFLPAAKAMASESPQYTYRKQPVPRPKQYQEEETVGIGKQPGIRQYRHNTLPHYAQVLVVEDIKDEETDEDDEPEHLPSKACGLLPRFCLGSSFFLMNPVPGMKTHPPASSVRTVKARPPYSSSQEKQVLGIPGEPKSDRISGSISLVKGQSTFQELLTFHPEKSDSASPAVEKTLYIDRVHKLERPRSNDKVSEQIAITESAENDFNAILKSQVVDYSTVDEKRLEGEKPVSQHGTLENVVSKGALMDIKKDAEQVQELISESVTFQSPNVYGIGNRGFKNHLSHKVDDEKKPISGYLSAPLNPPLPKSPSESWLFRTLPSASKNLSGRSYVHTKPKIQAAKATAPADPKWERIVRTSHVHHGHLPSIEEQAVAAPHDSLHGG